MTTAAPGARSVVLAGADPVIWLLGPPCVGPASALTRVPGVPGTILTLLGLHAPEPVTTDRLIEVLWPSGTTTGATRLKTHVSRLRSLLQGVPEVSVTHTGHGYRLVVDERRIDTNRFTELLALADDDVAAAAPHAALAHLDAALALWRGDPLAEVDLGTYLPYALRVVLDGALRARQRRCELLLDTGQSDVALPELRGLLATHPGNARLWILLIQSLQQLGRVNGAFEELHHAKQALAAEGIPEDIARLAEVEHDLLVHRQRLRRPTEGPDTARPAGTDGRDEIVHGLLAPWGETCAGRHQIVVLSGAHGVGLRHIVGRFQEAIEPTPLEPITTEAAANGLGDGPRAVLVDLHDSSSSPVDTRRFDLGAIGSCVASDAVPTLVLLVATSDLASRSTWLHGLRRLGPSVTSIAVPPLPDSALHTYLSGRFPHLDADAVAAVVALSGGMPSIATSLAGEHPASDRSARLVMGWLAQLGRDERDALLALADDDELAVTPLLERFGFTAADAIDRALTLDLLRPSSDRPLAGLVWCSDLVPRALRMLAAHDGDAAP